MQIDRVYKDTAGKWFGDVSGAMTNYPETKLPVIDSSEIPIPVPPPVLTSIDNTDTKLTYEGTWFNGPTTAPGFYGSTMAYSNITGNKMAFSFVGTSIEVFCEKKSGHGTGTFQVDSQPAQTINLGVDGPIGSTSVFKVAGLPNVEHKFVLTVAGQSYVVFDFIQIDGQAVIPTPIPPIPPTGDIIVKPGQSIKTSVESAAAGKTVFIQPGNYNEPNINVPEGVNVTANAGTVTITATTAGTSGGPEVGLFTVKSSSSKIGNQTISNLTLEGNDVGYGGILVENRDKVFIKNCNIRNFNFHGIWLRNVKDSEVSDNDLYNTAWATSAYSSGHINIFSLTNVTIQRNKIRSDKNNKGTGIEALWKQSTMKNLKILNNTFRLSHQNPWAGGKAKNFSIEIHDTHYDGIEIAFNDFGNQLSMASHFSATTSNKTLVHDNIGDLGGDTVFLENICDNFEAYNNTVTNAQMFAGNFQPNSVWKNNYFHHNTFASSGPVSWGGMFLIGPLGVQGFVIKDNVFKLNGNVKIAYMGTTGGVTESGNTWTP